MLKQMTSRVKCRSSGNSSLWLAVMEEKIVHESAVKFAATKSNAVASLLRWSKGEENRLLSHIFGRVAELNWMWKQAMDEFNNEYMNYRRYFKRIFQQEKDVEEYRKALMGLHPKVIKARKQVDAAEKKGDFIRMASLDNELETLSAQYDTLQDKVVGGLNRLELEKVACVRGALQEQANAFVELAEKCQVIFKAQCAMAELIPANVDASFLSEDHRKLFKNCCTLVSSVGEKLQMTPPTEGGIDSPETLQLFVSAVSTSYRNRSESFDEGVPPSRRQSARHNVPANPNKVTMVARTGNIGPPVPPRSEESLMDNRDETIYVIPEKMVTRRPLVTDISNDDGDYAIILYNKDEQLGLSRSYSDSQVLYSGGSDSSNSTKSKPLVSRRHASAKEKPPRPPSPKRDPEKASTTAEYSCPLFRDLTPSPSLSPPPEDVEPTYQTPIDALQSIKPRSLSVPFCVEKSVRSVSDSPRRLVRVRGSSRRKHQPVKRISTVDPLPILKSLSLDCLDSVDNSDDDYDEIYTNPYDSINAANKPIRVTARLSTSSAGIPTNCRPSSRQSNSNFRGTSPLTNLVLAQERSHSAECLDTIQKSDEPSATSSLLERRRLRNRHSSMDDSVKRLRQKQQLAKLKVKVPRKASMEIQTYPESPQHLRGVGSQENLFFTEAAPLTTTTIKESVYTESEPSKYSRKISNGIDSPKGKNRKQSRFNLFKKKPKEGSI